MGVEGEQRISSSSILKTRFEREREIKIHKRKIIKNLIVLCSGFVILFTAYNGLSMLQSTLNQEQGIGVVSQAIIYAGFCVSALLLPKYTIKKLGCKRTLVVSMSCYLPYIAANFYFNWLTMVPSAILIGLSASLLWSSQCTYFNESSVIYTNLWLSEKQNNKESKRSDTLKNGISGEITNKKTEKLNIDEKQRTLEKLETLSATCIRDAADNKLNCSYITLPSATSKKEQNKDNEIKEHFVISQCNLETINSKDDCSCPHTEIKENIITEKSQTFNSEEYKKIVSSVTARFFGLFGLLFRSSDIWSNLLSYYVLHDSSPLDNITENGTCSCGGSFCNVESSCFSSNLAEPKQELRNILTGVSVLLAFLGVLLILLFLDELETDKQPVKFSFSFAMATCKFASKKEALLLFPLSSYIGFQQAFYIGDFTKSYIACAWGVYHVGLVTVCYGAVAGISSTLSGLLVKYIGRIPVMLIGATINATINIYLLIWIPHPSQPYKFFIAAAMFGAAVGLLWSQLRAFYGVIFKNDSEAAFAGFYLWDSIGYCIAFSYSNYICTYIKIYILLSVSTIGMIGYLKTESIHMKQSSESKPD